MPFLRPVDEQHAARRSKRLPWSVRAQRSTTLNWFGLTAAADAMAQENGKTDVRSVSAALAGSRIIYTFRPTTGSRQRKKQERQTVGQGTLKWLQLLLALLPPPPPPLQLARRRFRSLTGIGCEEQKRLRTTVLLYVAMQSTDKNFLRRTYIRR